MAIPAIVPIVMGGYKLYKMYKTAKFIKAGYDAMKNAAPQMGPLTKAMNTFENQTVKRDEIFQFDKPGIVDISDKKVEAKVMAETVNETSPTSKVKRKLKSSAVNAKNFFSLTAKNIIDENKAGNPAAVSGVKKTLAQKGIDTDKLTELAGDVSSFVSDIKKGVKRGMK